MKLVEPRRAAPRCASGAERSEPPSSPGAMGCAGRPDLLLCALALFGVCLLPEARARVYTNHWALKIAGGFAEANRIAGKYGFINLGQVSGAPSPGSRCAPAAVPPCASCSLPAKFPGSRFYFLAPI